MLQHQLLAVKIGFDTTATETGLAIHAHPIPIAPSPCVDLPLEGLLVLHVLLADPLACALRFRRLVDRAADLGSK